MLHFTFQNMRAFYGPWPRGLGLKVYGLVVTLGLGYTIVVLVTVKKCNKILKKSNLELTTIIKGDTISLLNLPPPLPSYSVPDSCFTPPPPPPPSVPRPKPPTAHKETEETVFHDCIV